MLLRLPDRAAAAGPDGRAWEVGDRLLSCNGYDWAEEPSGDIPPGPRANGLWNDCWCVLADLLTDDGERWPPARPRSTEAIPVPGTGRHGCAGATAAGTAGRGCRGWRSGTSGESRGITLAAIYERACHDSDTHRLLPQAPERPEPTAQRAGEFPRRPPWRRSAVSATASPGGRTAGRRTSSPTSSGALPARCGPGPRCSPRSVTTSTCTPSSSSRVRFVDGQQEALDLPELTVEPLGGSSSASAAMPSSVRMVSVSAARRSRATARRGLPRSIATAWSPPRARGWTRWRPTPSPNRSPGPTAVEVWRCLKATGSPSAATEA